MVVKHDYDRESGLMFTEHIVEAPGISSTFTRRCTGQKPQSYRSPHGASSLEATALRAVVCNLDEISHEVLKCVPDMIVKRIWKAVKKNSLDSLRTWQLFVLAMPEDPPDTHIQSLTRVVHFDPVIAAVDSDSFAWLTVLSIEDSGFNQDEWFKLGRVKNLVFLDVRHSLRTSHGMRFARGSIDEIVIRGWNRMASNGGFPSLQTLLLQGQSKVTSHSLRYVNAFIALGRVGLVDCGIELSKPKSSLGTGWTRSTISNMSNAQFVAPAKDKSTCALWTSLVESCISRAPHSAAKESLLKLPLLLLSIGHRLENSFPRGTSGITWFEDLREHSSKTQQDDLAMSPQRKRRKLRDSKRQDLGDLLGDY